MKLGFDDKDQGYGSSMGDHGSGADKKRGSECFGIFITKVDTDTLGKIAEACDGRDSVSKVAIQDKKLSFKPAAVE